MDAKYDNQTVLTQELSKPEATFRLYHKTGVLPDLSLTLRVFDEGIINVKWTWPEDGTLPADKRKHFEIPTSVVNTTRASRVGDMVGKHVIIKTNPLVIQFTQQQGQTPVYFEIDRIIYDSYLNWIGMNAFTMYTDAAYKGVMGLGERSQQSLFYNDGVYSMWNTDQPPLLDTGVPPSNQGYGTHPFFMWPHSDNKWVGVFFKQAHAQDWIIENDKVNGVTQLKQVATGGITDIYVMVNSNTPDSVVSYYHRIVGKPFLPPVWALGWHQSKVCLRTLVENQDVVEKYNQYRIPLDV
jgi:alpha-glucosidase (family GH31 glycosyl hydrolase)